MAPLCHLGCGPCCAVYSKARLLWVCPLLCHSWPVGTREDLRRPRDTPLGLQPQAWNKAQPPRHTVGVPSCPPAILEAAGARAGLPSPCGAGVGVAGKCCSPVSPPEPAVGSARFSASSSGNGLVTAFPGQELRTLTRCGQIREGLWQETPGETHSGQLLKNMNPLTAPPDAAREARVGGRSGTARRCPRAARALVRFPSGAGSSQGCGHRMGIGWGMRVETTAGQWSREGCRPDVGSGWSTRCLGAASAGGRDTSGDRARCLPGPSQCSARHVAQVDPGIAGRGPTCTVKQWTVSPCVFKGNSGPTRRSARRCQAREGGQGLAGAPARDVLSGDRSRPAHASRGPLGESLQLSLSHGPRLLLAGLGEGHLKQV